MSYYNVIDDSPDLQLLQALQKISLVTLDYQFVDTEIVVESAVCDALKVYGAQPNIDTIQYIKCDFF